jgi:anti-repressor protein
MPTDDSRETIQSPSEQMQLALPISETFVGGDPVPMVDARRLHAFLEVKTPFTMWMSRRIEEYGFVEGREFLTNLLEIENPSVGRPNKEYMLSLDMAKEISMAERTEKGKAARQYFLLMERIAKQGALSEDDLLAKLDDPNFLRRLVVRKDEQLQLAKEKILSDAPKVEVYGKFLDSMGAVSIDEFAKRMASIGYAIGEKRAFEWLRWLKIMLPAPKTIPYQFYIQNGDFVVQEVTFQRGEKIGTSMQTRITSQGQIRLENLMQQTYHNGLKGFLTWWDMRKKMSGE